MRRQAELGATTELSPVGDTREVSIERSEQSVEIGRKVVGTQKRSRDRVAKCAILNE